jgi:hypothetical protein
MAEEKNDIFDKGITYFIFKLPLDIIKIPLKLMEVAFKDGKSFGGTLLLLLSAIVASKTDFKQLWNGNFRAAFSGGEKTEQLVNTSEKEIKDEIIGYFPLHVKNLNMNNDSIRLKNALFYFSESNMDKLVAVRLAIQDSLGIDGSNKIASEREIIALRIIQYLEKELIVIPKINKKLKTPQKPIYLGEVTEKVEGINKNEHGQSVLSQDEVKQITDTYVNLAKDWFKVKINENSKATSFKFSKNSAIEDVTKTEQIPDVFVKMKSTRMASSPQVRIG